MSREDGKIWTPLFVNIVVVTFLTGTFSVGLSAGIPLYIEQIGGSASFGGFLVSLFACVCALMRVVSGYWTDRFNHKALFLAGAAIMVVGCGLPLVSSSPAGLTIARIIQGFGNAVATTVIVVIIAEVVPSSRLGESLGYRGLGIALATAFGPSLAVLFVSWTGGLSQFFWFGLICAVSFIMGLFFRSGKANGGDAPVSKGDKQQPDSSERDEQGRDISDRLYIVRLFYRFFSPSVFAPSTIELTRRMITGICTAFMIAYALEKGIAFPGLFFIIASATIVACRVFAGKLMDTNKNLTLLATIFILNLIGFVSLMLFPGNITFIIASITYGIGEGIPAPYLNSMAFRMCPKDRWGVASGTFYLAGDIGMAIGSFCMGFVIDFFGFGSVTYGAVFCIAVTLILIFVLIKNDPIPRHDGAV